MTSINCQPRLTSLPPEILFQIMKEMPFTSAVPFGKTCKIAHEAFLGFVKDIAIKIHPSKVFSFVARNHLVLLDDFEFMVKAVKLVPSQCLRYLRQNTLPLWNNPEFMHEASRIDPERTARSLSLYKYDLQRKQFDQLSLMMGPLFKD